MARARDIIERLSLAPHPEGGFFRETFRDEEVGGSINRSWSTAIYYLLPEGHISHWHRIDSAEIWHWYSGAPLQLSIAAQEDQKPTIELLGSDFEKNQSPQIIVPASAWQSARSLGDWTLVGCTVAPGFEFDKFELADRNFTPGK